MSSSPKFKVAICGAGIGGLTTAIALAQYPDIEVDIYEGAERLAEVGAGLGVWPRPWEVLKRLGLEDELLKHTDLRPTEKPVPCFRYRKSDCPEGMDFYTLVTKGPFFASLKRAIRVLILLPRPDFQNALLRKLPHSYRVHCSKRLRSYSQRPGGPVTLLFEDGSQASCDVLVAADGIKSAARRSFLHEKAQWARGEGKWSEAADIMTMIEPSWSGTVAYRAVIPGDQLRARDPDHNIFRQPTQYIGRTGHIIAYPMAHGKMINLVAFTARHELEGTKFNGPWVCPTEKQEFLAAFRNWEPEVQALLDCVDKPLRWAIHTIKPLGSFISGNVAMIGDAAHAMTPHQGSGAGQAVEDAFILATVLGHPNTVKSNIPYALSVYDRIRRPYALKVQERSRLNGLYFTLQPPDIDFTKLSGDEVLPKLKTLGRLIYSNWDWAWMSSIGASVQEAVQLLDTLS